jgi:hypothetical protein
MQEAHPRDCEKTMAGPMQIRRVVMRYSSQAWPVSYLKANIA